MPPSREHIWLERAMDLPGEIPILNFSLIILNQPLMNLALFDKIWKRAVNKLAADGGANRLYDTFPNDTCRMHYIPDTIVGDLDSIRAEVRSFYSAAGTAVLENSDQNLTDFMKCTTLSRIKSEAQSNNIANIIVMGGLGGRADHAMATLNHLMAFTKEEENISSASKSRSPMNIYLISSENLTFVLKKGDNLIHADENFFGKSVGILPLGKPAVISTAGFEWDVRNWKTEFGGNVSTSNHVKSEKLIIATTEMILFTIELNPQANWEEYV
ncbi:MAG: hypothetical protein M1829_000813 [Trizodia sp. TS-e1964]|nr:MAG: hypothetical protein M1829_000813 [Trizodia sp. TS-e1964]